MRRFFRWTAAVGATVAFLAGCLCFFSANLAYQEADKWFRWATYKAECVPSGPPGCVELKLQEQPHWPYGIEVKNQDVLLAEAGALHNTGSAVLSLGGLSMAAASVLLATNAFGSSSSANRTPLQSRAEVRTTCAKRQIR
jgi:hypothetical protein